MNCLDCYYHLFFGFANWCSHPGHPNKIKRPYSKCGDHYFYDDKSDRIETKKMTFDQIKRLQKIKRAETFRIIENGMAIHCLYCGKISYNQGDVLNRYCAECKKFHGDDN